MAVGDEVIVLTWLHEGRRDTLQVHPRADAQNPMEAIDGTPVVDIKPVLQGARC